MASPRYTFYAPPTGWIEPKEPDPTPAPEPEQTNDDSTDVLPAEEHQ